MKVITFIVGLGPGGAEKFLLNLIKNSKGFDHTVVYLSKNNYYLNEYKENCKTLFLTEYVFHFLFKDILYGLKNKVILQGWMYHGMLFSALFSSFFKNKLLIWSFRHAYPLSNKLLTKILIYFLSFISKLYDPRYIFNSFSGQKNHKKLFKSTNKISVIPNGYKIKCSQDIKNNNKLKYFNDNKKINLISLNRWHKDKNLILMLKALREFKEAGNKFYLDMFGNNIDYDNFELCTILEKLDLFDNVKLRGVVKINKISFNFYHFHLISSSSESFPNVVCETMSFGIPNIATKVGDISKIVSNCGFVSKSLQVCDFLNCLNDAKETLLKGEYNNMSLACNERISKKYSINSAIAKFENQWI